MSPEPNLVQASTAIFSAAYWCTPGKALRPAKSEPEALAGLIANSTMPLANAWSHILGPANLDVTITSIFAHQRPQARFPFNGIGTDGSEGCELADWVVVHDHARGNRRAILIQTKMTTGKKVGGAKRLYTGWPPFRFGTAPRLRTH